MLEGIWKKLVSGLVDAGMATEEDAKNLRTLIEVLTMKIHDLRDSLEFHPQLQVTAAHYANYLDYAVSELSNRMEQKYRQTYKFIREKGDKRPSENQVLAVLSADPTYSCSVTRKLELEYFRNQLRELHKAYVTRARMLEQISNNARADMKDEQEDDLS